MTTPEKPPKPEPPRPPVLSAKEQERHNEIIRAYARGEQPGKPTQRTMFKD